MGSNTTDTVDLTSPIINVQSSIVDDLEDVRKAIANRVEVMTRTGPDKDGINRGWGLSPHDPNVQKVITLLNDLLDVEKTAVSSLEASMKLHPMHPWVKKQKGIGAKQFARLLATVGDPYIRPAYEVEVDGETKEIPATPRTVASLWSYCGLAVYEDGTVPRRKRGEKANWSTKAKTRAFLIAQKCMVVGINKVICPPHPEWDIVIHDKDHCECSPFRVIYDKRRLVTKDRMHRNECIRCGPSGSPAQPGSPLSKAHKHADALRVVSKEILKQMWIEARRLHQEGAPAKDGKD